MTNEPMTIFEYLEFCAKRKLRRYEKKLIEMMTNDGDRNTVITIPLSHNTVNMNKTKYGLKASNVVIDDFNLINQEVVNNHE